MVRRRRRSFGRYFRLLGRRQAVRHRILIPAFEGSIPSAPASRPHTSSLNVPCLGAGEMHQAAA